MFRWGIIGSWLNSRLFICVQSKSIKFDRTGWPYIHFPCPRSSSVDPSSTQLSAAAQGQILVCRFAHKHSKVELIGTFSTFLRSDAITRLNARITRTSDWNITWFSKHCKHRWGPLYVGPFSVFYRICQLVQKQTKTLWQRLNYAPSLSRHKHHIFWLMWKFVWRVEIVFPQSIISATTWLCETIWLTTWKKLLWRIDFIIVILSRVHVVVYRIFVSDAKV